MKITKHHFINWLVRNNIPYYWQYKYQDTPFILKPVLHVEKGTLDKFLSKFGKKALMFNQIEPGKSEYRKVVNILKET